MGVSSCMGAYVKLLRRMMVKGERRVKRKKIKRGKREVRACISSTARAMLYHIDEELKPLSVVTSQSVDPQRRQG